MTPAPTPVDEKERLRALHDLMLLDTPPDERFDRECQDFCVRGGLDVS